MSNDYTPHCLVCLGTEQPLYRYVNVCLCKGDNNVYHQNCYAGIIKRELHHLNSNNMSSVEFRCGICNYIFRLERCDHKSTEKFLFRTSSLFKTMITFFTLICLWFWSILLWPWVIMPAGLDFSIIDFILISMLTEELLFSVWLFSSFVKSIKCLIRIEFSTFILILASMFSKQKYRTTGQIFWCIFWVCFTRSVWFNLNNRIVQTIKDFKRNDFKDSVYELIFKGVGQDIRIVIDNNT
jgi:hypothetical protein